MRRVVVTGMGSISALGHDAPACWNAMREGRSGIAAIAAVDPALLKAPSAAEVRDFEDRKSGVLERG